MSAITGRDVVRATRGNTVELAVTSEAQDVVRGLPTLVVGGLKDFVLKSIVPRIAQHRLLMVEHWDMDRLSSKTPPPIPPNVEVVIGLVDMMPGGHRLSPSLRDEAAQRRIKYVATQRKWSILQRDLTQAGIPAADGAIAVHIGKDGKVEMVAAESPDAIAEHATALAALQEVEQLRETRTRLERELTQEKVDHQQTRCELEIEQMAREKAQEDRDAARAQLDQLVKEAAEVAGRAREMEAQLAARPTFDVSLLPAMTWEERESILKAVLRSMKADGLEWLAVGSDGYRVKRKVVVVQEVERTEEL